MIPEIPKDYQLLVSWYFTIMCYGLTGTSLAKYYSNDKYLQFFLVKPTAICSKYLLSVQFEVWPLSIIQNPLSSIPDPFWFTKALSGTVLAHSTIQTWVVTWYKL